MNIDFTHLHVHTEYSLLDSSAKIKELISRAKELNMSSIAITDHGNMFGVIDFYKESRKQGIKPIIGCEIYVANTSLDDKSYNPDNYYSHLILLAENEKGLYNLNKIVSKGYIDGFYYRPRVDIQYLKEHSEGLIALSACLAGPINRKLLKFGYNEAFEEAKIYSEIFIPNEKGEPCFYVELQNHNIEEQLRTNPLLVKIANELNLPLVCTNDVHYVNEEDSESHGILLCINTGKTINDDDRIVYEGSNFYLKSPEEMYEIFKAYPEAIENTNKIAQRCNVEIEFGKYKLPKFDTPEGYDALSYLQYLTTTSLKDKYGEINEEVQTRLDYELGIINEMGFLDYFLIVWDFIKYARDNGIIVGPGRGSAAGSIVAFALGITNIDPIKYDLLFERFLNPERVSMPDIDIDFCYERRKDVIDYVIQKYGVDCVAQIVTFGTLSARAVIRDTGRALAMSYQDVDRVAKMIPKVLGINLKKALKMSPELKEAYDSELDTKKLIDMALKLEGLPRHSSTHAAGVLITDKAITEYVPLAKNDDAITSQYTMTTLEELGLLKMDFLGLRTLTVIQNAVNEVIRKGQLSKDFNIDEIDYGDTNVYNMIGQGKTEGVFQLESAGMKSFMKELKPVCIEDIIAGVSLYRPGPMDFIPKYVKGKNVDENITYTDDLLIPILNNTYGCIVYQEQVMQIFQELAGYSLGRSDLVRRAMSKKKLDVMEKERKIFLYGDGKSIEGCIAKGVSEKNGNQIFDEMAEFAKYAFNKSHAAAYAVVGYQTAWLKYYYKEEFMAALMTSVMDSTTKIAEYIVECKNLGIKILPPNINEGYGHFTSSGDGVHFGLLAMKNVGKSFVAGLVNEREENGEYKSLTDLLTRIDEKDLNKRCIESLINGGALDCLGGKRSQYLISYERLMNGIKTIKKNMVVGQVSLFDIGEGGADDIDVADDLPNIPEFESKVFLQNEKDVLGVYLSGHPLSEYIKAVKKYSTTTSKELAYDESSEDDNRQDKVKAKMCGIVSVVTLKYTRKNDQMAFVTLEDLYGETEIVIFPKIYEKYKYLIREEMPLLISGTVNIQDDENGKILADEIQSLQELVSRKRLYVKIDENTDQKALVSIFKKYSGLTEVIVHNSTTKKTTIAPKNMHIDENSNVMYELETLLGKENVILK